MNMIAFDAHKRYTVASVERPDGTRLREDRIEHKPGAIQKFLSQWQPGSPVALETIGNWYWIVDEIEAAGMVPRLVNARKAKLMMGSVNKTDKLDARGLNLLQRNGTLPTVWIPPADIRDKRDIPRARMVLGQERTRLKNRIHASLAKYGLSNPGVSDLFGKAGRQILATQLATLPPETRYTVDRMLERLRLVDEQITAFEKRTKELFADTLELQLVRTLPGVGFILGTVIALEVGDVSRFPSAHHLASYAGTTPRVHSSGGKTRYGQLRNDVNRYLKFAFGEAANVVCINRRQENWRDRHVSQLYERIAKRKGHYKAIGAVARHLAEATYWILTKRERYQEPKSRSAVAVTSTSGNKREDPPELIEAR